MDYGSLIREGRREAGLTQAELAQRLGVTQSAVAQLERAGANPRIRTLVGALEAIGHGVHISRRPSPVDVAQLDARLALSPAERLARHDRARARMRSFVSGARRV